MVTSPPYFAGKEYEEELDREGVPGSYIEYLELLRDVFAECKRVLEPGGRIAVNVANLGRKPYRSLSADVIPILQDDLRLLLRGEIVWQKGEGASGSCAWGSFRTAANPVLRDVTERIVIAQQGPLRSGPQPQGCAAARPAAREHHLGRRVHDRPRSTWGHPARERGAGAAPRPFPVELPQRLIELYTYRTTWCSTRSGVRLDAAGRRRSGPDAVGYDLDPAYVELARTRLDTEGGGRLAHEAGPVAARGRARGSGRRRVGGRLARDALEAAGFTPAGQSAPPGARPDRGLHRGGRPGRTWYFDLAGPHCLPGGMARSETVSRALGRAHVLAAHGIAPFSS